MKFALCSDLHLEFAPIELNNTEDADVLVLSGDICIAKDLGYTDNDRSIQFMKFFEHCSEQFKNVIYIMGNHEHYHGDFTKSYDQLVTALAHLPNIHVLEKQHVTIGDVTFIGGTLWTNMNKEDPFTMYKIAHMMNDFRIIANGKKIVQFRDSDGNTHERIGKLTPEDVVIEHKQMLEYIHSVVDGKLDQKFVVVGHHAPSKMSTKPRYQGDEIMNGGYSSDLSEFILDHPQIKIFTHGHTHDKFCYKIGSTHILANPHGYAGHEDIADRFQLLYVEIDNGKIILGNGWVD